MSRSVVKGAVASITLELQCKGCGGFGSHDQGQDCAECDGGGHHEVDAEVTFDYLPGIPDSGWSPESYDPGCGADVSNVHVTVRGEDVTAALTESQLQLAYDAAQDVADSAETAHDEWCSSDE